MIACIHAHTERVQMLLDKGSDCNKYGWGHKSSMVIARLHSHTVIIIKNMLERGIYFNKYDIMNEVSVLYA